MKENLITTKDAGEFSGYTSDYLSRLIRSGKITGRKVGHAWLVDKESLERFLNTHNDRKTVRARELAQERANEYRTHRSLLRRATRVLAESITTDELSNPARSSFKHQALALSLSFALVVSGALAAHTQAIPRIAANASGLVLDVLYGFNETFGDIPLRIVSRINEARMEMRSIAPRVAAGYANTTASVASSQLVSPDLSGMRMTLQKSSGKTLVLTTRNFKKENSEMSLTRENIQAFVSAAYNLVSHPSLAINSLTNGYTALGEKSYNAILSAFDAYLVGVQEAGARTLSFGAIARDTLAKSPQFVNEMNLALGEIVISAAHAVVRADTAVAYGIADAAPASARITVAFLGATGDLLQNGAAAAPHIVVSAFLRATEMPARVAPAIASAVFDAEYAAAIRFVSFTDSVTGGYLAFVNSAGAVTSHSASATLALASAAKNISVPASSIIENSYLAALGSISLQLSPIERVALSTYETVNGFARGVLAFFFRSNDSRNIAVVSDSTPVVLPFDESRVVRPVEESALTSDLDSSQMNLEPRIFSPTYTTVVRGVSENFVNESLSTLRNGVLATVAGMIQPISRQTVTNATTIQQVNMIQDLSNLIVRNGDFRGGTLSNGTSVSATTGSFDNLTVETTTLGTTTISGTLTVNGIPVTGGGGGGGSGNVATSTLEVAGNLPYWTSTAGGSATLGSAANLTWDNTTNLFSVTGNASTSQLTTTGSTYLATLGGYVGIGNTSPVSRLDITNSATSSPAITLRDPLGNVSLELRAGTSTYANTFIGLGAGAANTTGDSNTANGAYALYSNTTGSENTANGTKALYSNTTGSGNSAQGYQTLYSNTTGSWNSAQGRQALYANTTGSNNFAQGRQALYSNTTGSNNSAAGYQALYLNESATSITAIGAFAARGTTIYSNQGGVYLGYQSGYSADTGSDYNTLLGYNSGYGVTTGARNVLIGPSTIAASYNQVTTGSNNIAIGNDVAVASPTDSNQLNIGNLIYGTGIDGTGTTLSTGNVGIGTTSPYARLSVVGQTVSEYFTATSTTAVSSFQQLLANSSTTLQNFTFVNATGTSATTTNFFSTTASSTNLFSQSASFDTLAVTGQTTLASSLSGLLQGASGVVSAITGTAGQFPYYSGTNTLLATSSIFLATSGNVGIGTASPKSKFEISQNSATTTFGGLNGGNQGLLLSNTNGSVGTAYGIEFGFVADKTFGGIYGVGAGVSSNSRGDIVFALRRQAGDTTFTESMRVNSQGDIGIGTSSPLARLDVAGSLSQTTPLFQVSKVGASYATSTALIINSSGSVGIGTTSPSAKFAITGPDATATGRALAISDSTGMELMKVLDTGDTSIFTASNLGGLTIGPAATTPANFNFGLVFGTTAANKWSMMMQGTTGGIGPNKLIFLDGGTNARVVFAPGGTVGIGSTTPFARLAITASSTLSTDNGFLVANSNDVPLFNIKNNGNAGIGTTSPYAKLSVVGETVAEYFTATSTTAVSSFQQLLANSSTTLQNFTFVNATGTSATTTNFFSTTASSTNLFSQSASFGTLAVTGSTQLTSLTASGQTTLASSLSGLLQGASGVVSAITGTAGQFPYYSGTNTLLATSSIFLATSGNVGIGTTSPWGLLSVNPNGITGPAFVVGSSTATSLIVTNGGDVGVGRIDPIAALDTDMGTTTTARLGMIDGPFFSVGQYQNYLLYTETIGNNNPGSWQKVGMVPNTVAETDVSPGGLSNGASVLKNGSSASANVNQTVTDSTLGPWTFSVYLKSTNNTNNVVNLRIDSGNGTATTTGTNKAVTLTSYWKRYSVTENITNAHTYLNAVINHGVATTSAWGTQLEPSAFVRPYVASQVSSNQTTINRAARITTGLTINNGLSVTAGSINFTNLGVLNVGPLTAGSGQNLVLNAATGGNISFNTKAVGVGTSTPFWMLQAASSTAPQLALSDGSLTSNHWTFRNASGNLYLASASPSTFATSTTALTIDTSGNVGIGTTSPWGKLSVTGAGTGTGQAFVVADSANTPRFNVLDNGNIGIGTTSPSMKLDVYGSINVAPDSAIRSNNNWLIGQTSGTNQISIGSSARANDIVFNSTSGEIVTIKTTGNVGIGTTSPYSMLSISNSATTAANTPLFTIASTTGGTSTSTLMTVLANGNVGIGTTSPTFPLDILSSTQNAFRVSSNHASGVAIQLQNINGGETFSIQNVSDKLIVYHTDVNTARFAIHKDGNVGIGSFVGSNPQNKLDVRGAVNIGTNFGVAAPTDGLIVEGNVGIGTTSPWGKLSITQTGTAGEPAFIVEDSASPDSSPFVIDETGRVLIGTANSNAAFGGQLQYEGTSANMSLVRYAAAVVGSNMYIAHSRGAAVGTNTILQNGDTIGSVIFSGANGTSFDNAAYIQGSIDGTPGASADMPGRLTFWTSPDGSVTPTEKMRITSGGNVGIGTTTPWGQLSVNPNGVSGPALVVGSSTATNFIVTNGGNVGIGTTSPWRTLSVAGTVGFNSSLGTGTGGNYLCIDTTTFEVLRGNGAACTASARRFKENIQELSYGLADVLRLRPVSYTYKPGTNMGVGTKLGFIADEMRNVIPEVVTLDENGEVFGLDYPVLTSVLTKAIQELDAKFLIPDSATTTIPSAVLTADGRGIDIFALATYAITGIQQTDSRVTALTERVISLENRIAALESGAVSSSSGSENPFSTTSLASALEGFGVLIQNGIAQFNTLVFRQLVASSDADGTSSAGSVSIIAGNTVAQVSNSLVLPSTKVFITFNSQIIGSWWVSDKQNGSFRVVLSETQTGDVSFDYFLVQTEGQITSSPVTSGVDTSSASSEQTATVDTVVIETATSTPTIAETSTTTATITEAMSTVADTIPPVVTLNDAAAMEVIVGSIFADPGATAVDHSTELGAGDTDLTASIVVTGSVDTATEGSYTLTYTATDAAGNSASVSRLVTVLASTSSPQVATEPAPEPEPAPATP